MTVTVLLSPGGSPGVTTTALALAMAWPRPVIMAECDPAGGSVLAGLWRGQISAAHAGLPPFALAVQRDPHAAARALPRQLLPLEDPPGHRSVLAAPPDPRAMRQIATTWPALAAGLASAGPDIIADAGRFDAGRDILPLLTAAGLVLMICRPDVRQAAAAESRLAALARDRAADGLILIGDGGYGREAPGAAARALAVPVTGRLPHDPAAAKVLSDGARPARSFPRSALMRAATDLARRLARDADAAPDRDAPRAAVRR